MDKDTWAFGVTLAALPGAATPTALPVLARVGLDNMLSKSLIVEHSVSATLYPALFRDLSVCHGVYRRNVAGIFFLAGMNIFFVSRFYPPPGRMAETSRWYGKLRVQKLTLSVFNNVKSPGQSFNHRHFLDQLASSPC